MKKTLQSYSVVLIFRLLILWFFSYLYEFVETGVAIKRSCWCKVHLRERERERSHCLFLKSDWSQIIYSFQSHSAHRVRLDAWLVLQPIGRQHRVNVVNDTVKSGVITFHDPRSVVDPDGTLQGERDNDGESEKWGRQVETKMRWVERWIVK